MQNHVSFRLLFFCKTFLFHLCILFLFLVAVIIVACLLLFTVVVYCYVCSTSCFTVFYFPGSAKLHDVYLTLIHFIWELRLGNSIQYTLDTIRSAQIV